MKQVLCYGSGSGNRAGNLGLSFPAKDFPLWSRKKHFLLLYIKEIVYWPNVFDQDGWISA